jgi:DNA-binding transcriptional LysR family regulator
MDVELRHLRAFAAVARQRSFTRAAEQLLITQPALTRTVQ